MSDVLTIAVLVGGPSAEAEVSRNSGAQVAAALAANGHSIHELELDQHAVKQLIELRPDVVFPVLHGPPGEDGTVQGMLEIGRSTRLTGVQTCAPSDLFSIPLGLPWLDMVTPNHSLKTIRRRTAQSIAGLRL